MITIGASARIQHLTATSGWEANYFAPLFTQQLQRALDPLRDAHSSISKALFTVFLGICCINLFWDFMWSKSIQRMFYVLKGWWKHWVSPWNSNQNEQKYRRVTLLSLAQIYTICLYLSYCLVATTLETSGLEPGSILGLASKAELHWLF